MDDDIEDIFRAVYSIEQELNGIRSRLNRMHKEQVCAQNGLSKTSASSEAAMQELWIDMIAGVKSTRA